MPDKYYTLKEFNKRITKRLKPTVSLTQRLRGLKLRLPRKK